MGVLTPPPPGLSIGLNICNLFIFSQFETGTYSITFTTTLPTHTSYGHTHSYNMSPLPHTVTPTFPNTTPSFCHAHYLTTGHIHSFTLLSTHYPGITLSILMTRPRPSLPKICFQLRIDFSHQPSNCVYYCINGMHVFNYYYCNCYIQ